MTRRLLALTAVAVALGVAPAHADPIPPNLRPSVTYSVDPTTGRASVGVWLGNYPLLGAHADASQPRACAGYGYTTGFCTDRYVDVEPGIEIGPLPL